ncbi:hypothetical protein Tco_0670238, partial [Tanacetum coccineum]
NSHTSTGIDNDIYSTVDACPNACEMWKAIERLKQGESINVQDLETNLYWCLKNLHHGMVNHLNRITQEWQRFVTLVKQSQELKTVSYHKLYDILKQHQNEVNELRAERLAHTANPLALIAQQQQVYHPQNHLTHYTNNSTTISQQAATRNRGKAINNSPLPTYDQEPEMVAKDDALSKEKKIDKLMALISLSFKKIYKPTNNNLRTSSNTSRANQDNTLMINRGTGYDNQRAVNVARARKNVGTQIQEVTPDAADNSGPIFDSEPLQEVQNDDDHYNVFDNNGEHPEQPESVNDTYLEEQGDNNLTIDLLDMSTNGETVDQDDDDLGRERDLLASLIKKLKYEIDDSKNRNKFLESSNKTLVDKLKALKKFQDELEKRHDVNYMSKVELDCAKAKTELMSYKTESQKSINNYSYQINDLNQKISDMKKELVAHQETISIMSQQKEDQMKAYKTREEKELEKVIALENKIQVLDDIVYKTGQSVQTMNMLNRNCKTSFVKPEFLKKAQRVNPRLYDIGCYNDNLALMLAPESDETIRLAQESRSKLSDLIRPFDYDKLNNLYDFLMFDELLNGTATVVSKSSAVNAADAPDKRQQQNTTQSTTTTVDADLPPLHIQSTPVTTNQAPTKAPTVTADKNINQAETNKEYAQVEEDEFINIFNHPLEQVIGNPSQSIRIRRQLETDGEMCMFALIVSRTEPKNIKEAMADSVGIEAKQEELTCLTISVWELRDMLSKRKEIDFESNFYLLLGLEKLSDISLRMHANKSFIQYTSDVKTNISFTVLLKERSRMQPDTRWIVLDPFFPTKSTVSKKALYGFKNKLHRACLR